MRLLPLFVPQPHLLVLTTGIGGVAWILLGSPAVLVAMVGIYLAFPLPLAWLTLRHRAREAAIAGGALHWRPVLGRQRVLPLTAIRAFEGVRDPLQARVVTARGHRDVVVTATCDEPGALMSALLAAAPDAPLRIPPRTSLHIARYYWDGLEFTVEPVETFWELTDFRERDLWGPVGPRVG
ncbi:MAG: hypothetical protein AB7O78_13365 [Thermoleophilia bacterium]